MVSAKRRKEKSVSKVVNPTPGPSTIQDVSTLIEKAHSLLAQSNFEVAIKILKKVIQLQPDNLEGRELLGVAELEGGDEDVGREHLLSLFPPHTPNPPQTHSPYLYLAQSAENPHEALGYYSTAAAMIENDLKESQLSKEEEVEKRGMAVTALVAMIEIWMSDLCFEDAAETNCDALISRAISISPNDPEVRLSLASIRMSQQRTEEAETVVMGLYDEIKEKQPFDESLPALPVRLNLTRQLLEHHLHLPALDIVQTIREEDSLNVEGAYLEGWALYLRGEALSSSRPQQPETSPHSLNAIPSHGIDPRSSNIAGNVPKVGMEDIDVEDGLKGNEEVWSTPEECFSEAMRSLMECAKLYEEQEYLDEGIGAHVAELLEGLDKKGVKPAEEEWEDEDDAEDVEMV
ncbi:hypothetical protein M231_03724 [Tremella mesenterica]|uniref:Uncharacterized protein n=1 Tax=Tremella mesenterica TaxID=5217 RepID=A0A4Q1BMF3_TREME|nr:hypothetical protein M231_03724 [Tremella mesenterica]